jgi:predicted nucleic acid-binding protein
MLPSLHAGLLMTKTSLERVRTDDARVPSLVVRSAQHTLIVNERRGRLTESDATAFAWVGAPARHARSVAEQGRRSRACRHRGRTVCDAAYLELTRREGAPLATIDSDLATAAHAKLCPY